jgi:hypothetical protein
MIAHKHYELDYGEGPALWMFGKRQHLGYNDIQGRGRAG